MVEIKYNYSLVAAVNNIWIIYYYLIIMAF